MEYKHSGSSVGANKKHIQLTPKYRYHMMQKEKLKVMCRVAIEEACKRHKIEIEIIKVMPEHVHLIADVPRTMSDAMALQIVKGLSRTFFFDCVQRCESDIPTDISGQKDIFATVLVTAISLLLTSIYKTRKCITE